MSRRKKTKPIKGKGKRKGCSPMRKFAQRLSLGIAAGALFLSLIGGWFVSHPWDWIAEKRDTWPRFIYNPLVYFGDRTILLTDGLGITGHDAVYDPDEPAPSGSVLYAGAPVRTSAPAPTDIEIIDRGPFILGYSPSLRHAVWAAYHIPAEPTFEAEARPGFKRDESVLRCAKPADYTKSGFDRGHLAPNHAIATRFGPAAQRATFLMSNVAPQRPALNRGPWRYLERTAADLWTRRYGEIWIIVGSVSRKNETLPNTDIDVPDAFWQVIVAQTDEGVRCLALYLSGHIPYGAFPVHNIVSLEKLERLTGFEFFPEMPKFLKSPLAADVPTRLWPVNWYDLWRLCYLRLARF